MKLEVRKCEYEVEMLKNESRRKNEEFLKNISSNRKDISHSPS